MADLTILPPADLLGYVCIYIYICIYLSSWCLRYGIFLPLAWRREARFKDTSPVNSRRVEC